MKKILFTLISLLSLPVFCQKNPDRVIVKPGIEVLAEEQAELLKGKRIGLITNPTGIDSQLQSSIDIIHKIEDAKLSILFAPEHGIRGGLMGYAKDETDEKTGLPVYTIRSTGPTDERLQNIELLIFDMQDIGARSYTYITTMKYCMDVSAKNKIPLMILDRPNPIGGLIVDGPVLDMDFQSDIGIGPLAYVHGMTIGEIALFLNDVLQIKCDLSVIKMKGWRRDMSWDNTGLTWVPTSPHIPEPDTPFFYPMTGIMGELPLVSVGVGYTLPFKVVGAPWIDAERVATILNAKKLRGVYFQPFHFTPFYGLFFKGNATQQCHGFRIIITDKKNFMPVTTGYHIMEVLLQEYPKNFNFSLPDSPLKTEDKKKRLLMFDKANGTDLIRKQLLNGIPAEEIIKAYQPALTNFIEKRKKYLLYK